MTELHVLGKLYSARSELTPLTNPAIIENCQCNDVTGPDAEADSRTNHQIRPRAEFLSETIRFRLFKQFRLSKQKRNDIGIARFILRAVRIDAHDKSSDCHRRCGDVTTPFAEWLVVSDGDVVLATIDCAAELLECIVVAALKHVAFDELSALFNQVLDRFLANSSVLGSTVVFASSVMPQLHNSSSLVLAWYCNEAVFSVAKLFPSKCVLDQNKVLTLRQLAE